MAAPEKAGAVTANVAQVQLGNLCVTSSGGAQLGADNSAQMLVSGGVSQVVFKPVTAALRQLKTIVSLPIIERQNLKKVGDTPKFGYALI